MRTLRTSADLRWLIESAPAARGVLIVARTGAGSTGVVRRIGAMMRAPEGTQAVECAWLYTAARLPPPTERAPLRAPHHTCSFAAIVGGMGHLGEVSLAHDGLLCLFEAPEFPAHVLRSLGCCLRQGSARLQSRGQPPVDVPAAPRLVVAVCAPCPCGQHGTDRCACSEAMVKRYTERVAKVADALGLTLHVTLDVPQPELRETLDEYNERQVA